VTISNIDSSAAASGLASPIPLAPPANPSTAATSAGLAPPRPPTQFSGPGQLFGRLQQLAEQDPAKFKAVAQSISDQLRAAAKQGSGKGADFENQLADRFAAAAQAGDLSALQPKGPPGGGGAEHAHHHHGHHGGGGAGSGISAIFASALQEVNQALEGGQSSASGAAAEGSATTA
jgi:hypothetical protein